MRPNERISTHMSFSFEIVVVFLENDLLALMLNRLTALWISPRRRRFHKRRSARGTPIVYQKSAPLCLLRDEQRME